MKTRLDIDSLMVSPIHPASLGWIRYAIVVLGVVLLTFVWGMYQYHHHQLHAERLGAKGSEHLNLAVIIAENTRQMAERGRALGSLYRAVAVQQNTVGVSVPRLLADDPVFNRISIYNNAGELLFASMPPSLQQLPEQWLSQLHDQAGVMGAETAMPRLLATGGQTSPAPQWRLPFLIPLNRDYDESAQIMLIEMDMNYLLSLHQYIDLGESGFVQLLDANGHERVRADSTGLVIDGPPLLPLPPQQPEGVFASMSGGHRYQSAFYSLPQHGFTVVLSKEYAEILAPYLAGKSRQLLINVLVSLITILCVLWMLRLLHRQQLAVETVQYSQQENKRLISQLEAEHERSSRAASTDHLSGLHNRRQFIEEANRAVFKQRNKRRLLSLLFIDLDRFKSINDTLGHRIGDLLLQAVAGRIQRLLGPDDQAARFGGDEFVVLLAGDRTEQDIVDWVDTLAQRLSAVYQLESNEVNTSPSIGVAICPRDAQDVDTLIRYADAAMYSAKRAGRGQYRFFDQSLNVVDVEEFSLEQAFAEALRRHQFVLHYQPQIALDTLSIIGYEALVRWQHPEYGLIYPDRFIPIAERSGFIIALGNEVISLACQQLAEWAAEGTVERVSVNVSALQLSQPEFTDMVLNEIQRCGLEAWQLELEITETAIFEQREVAVAGLERLRMAGLTISLDDFGAGYAGFAHLNALPINKLKIDRSLIAELSNSHDDSFIVSSTITLAKRLALQVVAEGVETPEQVVYLRLAGCDVVQGYHFSRPLRADQVTDFWQTFRIKNRISA